VPPAIEALLHDRDNHIQAFLAAGHVCTVMGYWQYEPIAQRYRIPIVVTGFEPLDLLQGIYLCIRQLEAGRAEVENQYSRSVRREGNRTAQDVLRQVFAIQPQHWRGIGEIPNSGLALAPRYARFDALRRFAQVAVPPERSSECTSGEILRGLRKPNDCPAFGTRCTPEHPLGATMVSSEGACAAYYRYGRPRAASATAAMAASAAGNDFA
jgi:hydrogenase expression/formation protein HypD